MYISKKELLSITGISYGQLYRWKRENLIPEEWFIKQSSYTGQETFFPKDKILNRIEFIMNKKDNYSLEEISNMLSYTYLHMQISSNAISDIEEINNYILTILNKNNYCYIEIVFMVILSKLLNKGFEKKLIHELVDATFHNIRNLKSTEYIFVVYLIANSCYGILCRNNDEIVIDNRMKLVGEYNVQDISNDIKCKYSEKLNLMSGEESDEK